MLGATSLEIKVAEMLKDTVEQLGFDIVRVKLMDGRRKTLQIMIDHLDETKDVTAADCAKVSRTISAVLDVEDPISGEYNLEISSPGIDRPLMRLKDFERFAEYEVKMTLHTPVEGRKRFKGKLLGVEEGNIRIEDEGVVYAAPFDAVASAKLVLTDELLAKAAAAQQETL